MSGNRDILPGKIKYILKKEKNYNFIPTSLFRDRSLIRDFNDKNIPSHRLYTIKIT